MLTGSGNASWSGTNSKAVLRPPKPPQKGDYREAASGEMYIIL